MMHLSSVIEKLQVSELDESKIIFIDPRIFRCTFLGKTFPLQFSLVMRIKKFMKFRSFPQSLDSLCIVCCDILPMARGCPAKREKSVAVSRENLSRKKTSRKLTFRLHETSGLRVARRRV